MRPSKTTSALFLILAAAFISRMALIVYFQTYAHPVVWEHEEIANSLLAGQGYSFKYLNTVYWSSGTPLFPFLCAAIYWPTNHSYLAVLILQTLFSMALALTVFFIARKVFGEHVGLLAALLVAFHPGFIYYDVFNLLPLSLDSFFIALIALLLLRIDRHGASTPMKLCLLLGVFIGLGTLSRGIIGVLLVPVIIYLLVLTRGRGMTLRLKLCGCVIAATFLVLTPWLVRNYLVHHQFVFISTSSGELFWRGNNQYATGTLYGQNKTKIRDLWPQEFRDRLRSMTELEQKKFFETEARRFIREHPVQAAGLYLRKVYYFWWFSPQSGINYPESYLTAYRIFYAGLLALAVVGTVVAFRLPRREVRSAALILIAIPIAIGLTQSLFYVEGRHRWLVEPLIIIFSCYGLTTIWSWRYVQNRY